ncbi:MAG: filamentous hemagglutinin N-terminal domain-containing protein [Cyanobacteria bacterium J06600_6]
MLPATFGESSFRFTAALLAAGFMLKGNAALAQITSDRTTNTQVNTNEDFTNITGGIEAGNNLFHSFEQFSLIKGAEANFEHSSEIVNIFSRVTGGEISAINGLIQTEGDASLFLLNPAGIVFGDNAQLDVGGSFIVSTGDRFMFADGTEFDAVTPKSESLLTVSLPIGIQYGAEVGTIEVLPNNDPIANNFDLSVYPGNTLALLGGDIFVSRNSLDAVSGKIEVSSVKSGMISFSPDEFGWQFEYADVAQFGQIEFSDHANIRIDGGGRVNFQGQEIAFSAASGVLDFNQFSELKTKVNLTAAEAIEIDGGLIVTQIGLVSDLAAEIITDVGGNITLDAPQILISNGAIISAATLSRGDGGSIKINARNLRLYSEGNNNPAIITTSTGGTGQGGSIEINTDQLQIENGGQIQALTTGTGSGGTIAVNAEKSIKLSGTGILRSQDIERNISSTELASGFVASSGDESLSVAEQSGLTGTGGSLIIETPKLVIDQSAQISVGSYGAANAGDIEIHSSNLKLDRGGQIVANTASTEGGSINVRAEHSLILDRHSSISTTAASAGNGGNITLITENLALLNSNRISADASVGKGGNIQIEAQNLFIDPSSSITASSEVEQNEGSVEISTLDLNSRLATDYSSPSSFVAEDKITSGCGVGISLHSNQIRDVGRGGIPNNPFREMANLESLSDLETKSEPIALSKVSKTDRQINRQTDIFPTQSIVEVNRWVKNSQGRVELIADSSPRTLALQCLVNSSEG